MYRKFIVASDEITYKATSLPLDEASYVAAARFVQSFLNIKNPVVIPIKNKPTSANPAYNILFRNIRMPEWAAKAPDVIVHETIHYLQNKKNLPREVTLWAARAMDIIYSLQKYQTAKWPLTNFYYKYEKHDEKKYMSQGWHYYKLQRADAENKTYEHIVADFDKLQNKKAGFFQRERYDLGAFVGGIVKGILMDTQNMSLVILFLHRLLTKAPLADALQEILLTINDEPRVAI